MAGRFDDQSISAGSAGRFDAQSQPSTTEPPQFGFLNRAIASSFGAPVDLANFGLNLMGLGTDRPILGSRNIEELLGGAPATQFRPGFSGIEFPAEGQQPTTTGQFIQRGIGETAGALVPLAGLTGLMAKGTNQLAAPIARTMMEGTTKAPIITSAADIASGVTSGLGAQGAIRAFPDNDTAEALGSLAGGLVPAGLAGVPRIGLRVTEAVPGSSTVIRGTRAAITPFTKAGGLIRAERRAQSLVADPRAVAGRLGDEEFIADLSPAQRTGETRLLALERAVLDKDVALESEFAEQTVQATQQLRDELSRIASGSVHDTRSFLQKRRDRLANALDIRAKQAAAEAQRRIAQLSPERRATESSVIVRDEIEGALGAARTQENALWGDVPQDITVPTDAARQSYNGFRGQLSRAQQEDIPAIAKRFLGDGKEAFMPQETVKEMHGLYSKLREDARIARADNKFNTARVADGIADAILDDLSSATDVGEAFDLARLFSFELNERFTRGAVGRVLGRQKSGGKGVDPQLTLQTTVGRGGDRGSVEALEVLRAAPAAQSEMGQFIMGQFQQAAVKNGQLNPQLARQFVAKSNFLDNFPQLRTAMLRAAGAQEQALRTGARGERITKSLRATNQSAAGEFLGARPGEEISRIIRLRDPRSGARELRRQVRKDPSGKALAGLKTAAIDHIILKSETGSFDPSGNKIISGVGMKATLVDKPTMSALAQILDINEIGRLSRVSRELTLIEKSRGRLPDIGGVISDVPSSILNVLVRVLSAQQGRVVAQRLGGGTVQTPGIFSTRAREILTNLTNDTARELLVEGVKDKRLFSALLAPRATFAQQKEAGRRFNAWLAGPGQRFAESLETEDE